MQISWQAQHGEPRSTDCTRCAAFESSEREQEATNGVPGHTTMGARTLLGAPGIATRSILTTSNKIVCHTSRTHSKCQKLQRVGFSDQMEVDLAGAGFEVAIVLLG